MHKRPLLAALLTALSGTALADTAHVTTADDNGDGSFRAAVAAANADPAIDTIAFDAGLDITLLGEVHYTGDQGLALVGNGSVLRGDCDPAATWDGGLFASYSAADIAISGLDVLDSCNNGVGIFIPEGADGEVGVTLMNVTISGSGYHGLYIDNQDSSGAYNTDDVPHPECMDPHPYDAKAGVSLTVIDSHVDGNGVLALTAWEQPAPIIENEELTGLTGCPADFDGIRVDDGGAGGISAWFAHSTADHNLADGIELDERGGGDVVSWAYDLSVVGNGETSAYEIVLPNGDTITDLDDGFDIDEEDNGELLAVFEMATVSENRDEGLDLDEAGNGSATVYVASIEANANEDQGVKVDESGNGSLYVLVDDAIVNDSLSQNGIEFTEEDNGSLEADIVDTQATGNDDAAVAGEQTGRGYGLIRVSGSDLAGNGDPSFDLDNIDVTVDDASLTD
jgi:hypothetical protein